MSNFGIFTMPALQIWPCHVNQEANFEKILSFPNFAFNIEKSCKISSRKALHFRSYQPKTSWGVENTPSAFRVNPIQAGGGHNVPTHRFFPAVPNRFLVD